MKVLFAGPTLPDASLLAGPDITTRPPACQGDIFKATNEGANVIGLVDGNFEYVAPIWHKEILYALSQGVTIYGASSMGALRAAECAAFGMIGVGEVYLRYASGEIEDDAAVAQLHAPPELSYQSLTLPKVNMDATLASLLSNSTISVREFECLTTASDQLFFKDRTRAAIMRQCKGLDEERQLEINLLLKENYIDQKRIDALSLIVEVKRASNARSSQPISWDFHSTTMWQMEFTP